MHEAGSANRDDEQKGELRRLVQHLFRKGALNNRRLPILICNNGIPISSSAQTLRFSVLERVYNRSSHSAMYRWWKEIHDAGIASEISSAKIRSSVQRPTYTYSLI